MSLLDKLLPCSFKGAVWLISSSSLSGGRKDQKHSYPNSDRQTIEDFGLDPRSYNIAGWITSDPTDDNYIDKRDLLLRAIESEDSGTLSHPLYGILNDMKARSFTIDESMSELGRGEISITFEISDNDGSLIANNDTLSLVSNANDQVVSTINTDTANDFKVDNKFINNFALAQNKLTEYAGKYDDATKTIVTITDNVDAFNALISNFGGEINNLIQTPQNLADSMTNIGKSFNGLYATVESQVIAWKELFGFGDNDIITQNITAPNIQSTKNNSVINRAVKAESLSYSYFAAVRSNYGTTNDLDLASTALETQYEILIQETGMSFELRDALADIRQVSNNYFTSQRITLQRIIKVNTPRLPARVIAYQYYGSSELGQEIARLNSNANVSFIEGEIEIVTQ